MGSTESMLTESPWGEEFEAVVGREKIDNKRLSIQQIIHLVACGWNIESLMYFETYYHSHLCNTRAQTDWLDAQCVPWTPSILL